MKTVLLLENVLRATMKSTPSLLLSEDQSTLPTFFFHIDIYFAKGFSSCSSSDIGFTSSTRIIVWEEEWECWAEREERIFSIINWG